MKAVAAQTTIPIWFDAVMSFFAVSKRRNSCILWYVSATGLKKSLRVNVIHIVSEVIIDIVLLHTNLTKSQAKVK